MKSQIMTSSQIRQSFLDFFASKEHRIVESAPVVPYGDPTLLFINAGMNQFKDVFLGSGTRDYKRATDTQKCIRVSGKHNDLEEVGVDTYHHTLFEMLGNWSFGDYYKVEAIDWAWELLTKVWKLNPERLYATVYRTDDEAYELWKKYLPESHIQRFDEKDNFWEMGATGPCGPCSEVHYDRTADLSGAPLVNAGSPDVIEIWNLVFIQFNRKPDGSLEQLANKFVDTGMGFERICSILQAVKSNYDTDVFTPIIHKIETLSNTKYGENEKTDIAIRVIADHIRTLSFAIADGALPGNEGRSYVLRRILRRGLRYARYLGFKEPMMYKLVQTLVDTMGNYFKELSKKQQLIENVIKSEEESFLQTMERGIELIDELIRKIKESSQQILKGEDAFQLYDTFGFPLDLTELIARENGIAVDTDGFEEKMNEQKERSRASRKETFQQRELPDVDVLTEFIGYSEYTTKAKILYAAGNLLVFDKTPFYVEMGGQVSDIGSVTLADGRALPICDVKKNGNAIFHFIDTDNDAFDVATLCKVGEDAIVAINIDYRRSIMRNHTATHLLHEALRITLGEHLHQSGSLVTADHLRFDFNHFEKVTDKQLKHIERIVNDAIIAQLPVKTDIYTIEEAKKNPNIKMFFGDKYGDIVRAVSAGDFALELCGGTHTSNTSEILLFKIVSEASIAAGVRRIEAITGKAAIEFVSELENQIEDKVAEINALKDRIKNYEKEIEKAKKEQIASASSSLISGAKNINGIRVLANQLDLDNLDQLRTTAEKVRETFSNNGICLIAAVIDDKVQLACSVTDDIKGKYPAGKLVGEAAKMLGGGGGGKPHLATAGGRDISKVKELIDTKFYELIQNNIG
ncbi:MAG: alanine--tRNA ligase [Ignavibacteria bacterium]|jgi:alanyl-tRNA synthetase|nr:alanine--tRNA ligase [Ignavibacteria bacterium]